MKKDVLNISSFFYQLRTPFGLILIKRSRFHHFLQIRPRPLRLFLIKAISWSKNHLKKLVFHISTLFRISQQSIYHTNLILHESNLTLVRSICIINLLLLNLRWTDHVLNHFLEPWVIFIRIRISVVWVEWIFFPYHVLDIWLIILFLMIIILYKISSIHDQEGWWLIRPFCSNSKGSSTYLLYLLIFIIQLDYIVANSLPLRNIVILALIKLGMIKQSGCPRRWCIQCGRLLMLKILLWEGCMKGVYSYLCLLLLII